MASSENKGRFSAAAIGLRAHVVIQVNVEGIVSQGLRARGRQPLVASGVEGPNHLCFRLLGTCLGILSTVFLRTLGRIIQG